MMPTFPQGNQEPGSFWLDTPTGVAYVNVNTLTDPVYETIPDAVVADLAPILADITTLQGDVSTLQGDVSTLQGDVSTLQGDVSTLQGDVSTLQGEMSTAQGDITALQDAAVFPWRWLIEQSSAGILNPSTPTAIPYDQTAYQTGGMIPVPGSPSPIVIPADGCYHLAAAQEFNPGASGSFGNTLELSVNVNGAFARVLDQRAYDINYAGTGQSAVLSGSVNLVLEAGDTVEIIATHTFENVMQIGGPFYAQKGSYFAGHILSNP